MEKTKLYRLQKRKYSSNVIEKNIGTEQKPKWIVILCPTEKKEVGDKLAEKILNFLNKQIKIDLKIKK